MRSAPKRRRPQALFHRGQRVVPSAFNRRRGPRFQRCQQAPSGSKLIAKGEGVVQRHRHCMRPNEQGLMVVHGASAHRKLRMPCGGHGARAVDVLGQRGERPTRPERAKEDVVRGAVVFREEPATMTVCTNRFHGRAGEFRPPPHADVKVEQVFQRSRHHRDGPPWRVNRALRRLRKEARRPWREHAPTRKVPRVNPALGVRIPQGQGRAR